jgi:hypothetical protein
MKILAGKQEQVEKEIEGIKKPKLDKLSMQIADMMEDRKGQDVGSRLYQKG